MLTIFNHRSRCSTFYNMSTILTIVHNVSRCSSLFILFTIIHNSSPWFHNSTKSHKVSKVSNGSPMFTSADGCSAWFMPFSYCSLPFAAARVVRVAHGCFALFAAACSCSLPFAPVRVISDYPLWLVKRPHNLSQFHTSFLLVIGCYVLLVTDIWCLHYC